MFCCDGIIKSLKCKRVEVFNILSCETYMMEVKNYHIVVQVLGELARRNEQLRGLFVISDPFTHFLAFLCLDTHVQV